jgi:hypothetical protein
MANPKNRAMEGLSDENREEGTETAHATPESGVGDALTLISSTTELLRKQSPSEPVGMKSCERSVTHGYEKDDLRISAVSSMIARGCICA